MRTVEGFLEVYAVGRREHNAETTGFQRQPFQVHPKDRIGQRAFQVFELIFIVHGVVPPPDLRCGT